MTDSKLTDLLIERITPLIAPMGYEVVYLEILTHRQKTIRVFIDHLDPKADSGIGIEDCVKVTRALDEPLDQMSEVEHLFSGAYELEVSSPGIDRPLRQEKDFTRFAGRNVRVHVFRPLNADEMSNPGYQGKNPKQKNFVGRLLGLQDGKVLLDVSESTAGNPGKKAAKKNKSSGKSGNQSEAVSLDLRISIPFPLISKANLEPVFDEDAFEGSQAIEI